jgi:hypothetical protein
MPDLTASDERLNRPFARADDRKSSRFERLLQVEALRSGVSTGKSGSGATLSPERAPAKVRNPQS